MTYLEATLFINQFVDLPIIDVRSPSEYENGHISGAVNIPIFSDEERASVGTIYKNDGKTDAIEKGIEIVGPKMKILADHAKNIALNGRVKLYCWRGGMRSEKMAWLFELIGLECFVLSNGYKAYRNQLLADFNKIPKLIVLQGPTGSGKTDILNVMESKGEQVIDLEGFAHHKGSAFGHIGMQEQPTAQQFQNEIHKKFVTFDIQKRIWVESESLTIGKVYLPETLWNIMNEAHIIQIDIPKAERIARLVNDYGTFHVNELVLAAEKIKRKFGGDKVHLVKDYLVDGRLDKAADLLLDYYDRSYMHSQNLYKKGNHSIIKLSGGSVSQYAEKIIRSADENRL